MVPHTRCSVSTMDVPLYLYNLSSTMDGPHGVMHTSYSATSLPTHVECIYILPVSVYSGYHHLFHTRVLVV